MSFFLYMLLGGLIGASIVVISYQVAVAISRSNLPELIRDALRSSNEQAAREMLAEILNATVEEKDENTISLSVLAQASGNTVKINITGTSVDSGLMRGTEISVY